MVKEIGSDFKIGAGLFFNKKRNNLLRNSILLASGRDCIFYIVKSLNLKTILFTSSDKQEGKSTIVTNSFINGSIREEDRISRKQSSEANYL